MRETVQKNVARAEPASRQEMQHQGARTPSLEESQIYSCRTLRQRRPFVQTQPHRQCQILEDPLSRGHDNNGNTFAVLTVVLIQMSTLEIQIMVS